MKILILRHGDPDYDNDCLTQKGRREAELLSERLKSMNIDAFYVSPLGRAQQTAEYTLEKYGARAHSFDWLREFDVLIDDGNGGKRIAWDMLPRDWTSVPEYYDRNEWYNVPIMKEAGMEAGVKRVRDGLDGVLKSHGYVRNGGYYDAVRPNGDTIAFFCHFGVTCVMLAHLLGVSPVLLWHGTISLTTSLTLLCSEERRPGAAYFRMSTFGDVSHLYMNGEKPSFSGRFCEMYTNEDERHD